MKTKKILTITLVFILILTSTSLAFADTSKQALDVRAIQLREELKNEFPVILEQHHKKNSSIDFNLGRVKKVEKKVIIDKTNDLNAIKQSFDKPVTIYSEIVTTEVITPLGATLKIETKTQTEYNGATAVTFTNRIRAWKDGTNYYKLESINCYWSTNNVATGDSDSYGGYVEKMVIDTDQFGDDKTGVYRHPVIYDNTINYASSSSDGTLSKLFSPDYYSYVSSGIGACMTVADYTVTFVFPGYPYSTTSTIELTSKF